MPPWRNPKPGNCNGIVNKYAFLAIQNNCPLLRKTVQYSLSKTAMIPIFVK
jgi:hypothetical protein